MPLPRVSGKNRRRARVLAAWTAVSALAGLGGVKYAHHVYPREVARATMSVIRGRDPSAPLPFKRKIAHIEKSALVSSVSKGVGVGALALWAAIALKEGLRARRILKIQDKKKSRAGKKFPAR